MARYLLIAILFLHGLVHLVGFTNAFQWSAATVISRPITRMEGLGWLNATVLFIISGSLALSSSRLWPLFAIAAVLLSQLLIFTVWKDAKLGTLANLIITIVAIISFANYSFQQMAEKEATLLLTKAVKADSADKAPKGLNELPPLVMAWLKKSGALDHETITSIRLRQKGEMRLKPGGKWISFQSTQYVNTIEPAFVWNARVNLWPMIYLNGRDKLEDGQGSMLIKALSLFKVVHEGPGPQMNQGTLLRYLSEIVWYPLTALNKDIHWRQINDKSVEATLESHGLIVSGTFTFDEQSLPVSFTCRRYYGGGKDSKLQDWTIQAHNFRDLSGILVPTDCSVTWGLPTGNFEWLRLSIITMELNPVAVEP